MFDNTYDSKAAMMERRAQAEASIRAKARRQEAQGYAIMAGFAAYEEAAAGKGVFAKVNAAAKWVLIWMAMIAPILLVIQARFYS